MAKNKIVCFIILIFISLYRLKGAKRVDQYRLLCTELELFTKIYATTPHHRVILENIRNFRAACKESNDGDEDEINGMYIGFRK